MTSPGGSEDTQPPLLPTHSNSLSTAQYLMRIIGEIQDSVNELNGMDISNEAASGLKSLLESTKWRFDDILARAWLRGESLCPQLPSLLSLNLANLRCEYILLPGKLGTEPY